MWENEEVKEIASHLQQLPEFTRLKMIDQKVDGINEHRASWGHPAVAFRCLAMLNPKFQELVDEIVARYMRGEVTTEE